MEEKALFLRNKIDDICGKYNIYKEVNVIDRVNEINIEIQEYILYFLQGNIFGLEEEEYTNIHNFAFDVLKDYSEAVINRDMVLMVDTLDYGLRDLINILI